MLGYGGIPDALNFPILENSLPSLVSKPADLFCFPQARHRGEVFQSIAGEGNDPPPPLHALPIAADGEQLANSLFQLILFGLAGWKCLWGVCVLKCPRASASRPSCFFKVGTGRERLNKMLFNTTLI